MTSPYYKRIKFKAYIANALITQDNIQDFIEQIELLEEIIEDIKSEVIRQEE